MWYEGKILRFEEPDDELKEFFADNEFLEPNFEGVDDPSLVNEEPITIMDNTELPWIDVPIEVPHKDLFEEANHLLYTSCFTAHRPASAGWLSLAIHGISSVHTNCAEDYGLPDDYEYTHSQWTEIAKFCPKTVQWMNDCMLYDKFTRVRFMALLPGGWLGMHRDRPSVHGVGATNVALNNPDGCSFVMGGWGTLPWEPGKVMKMNTGYEHSVWNRNEEEPRIHMIFDGDPSDAFKDKVKQGYAKMLGV